MRKIAERCADIKTIANIIGADYIVTGDIQSNNDRMRVYVQLIDTFNSQLTWSKMYQRKLNSNSLFDVQDEIVKRGKNELEQMVFENTNPVNRQTQPWLPLHSFRWRHRKSD